MAIKSQSFPMIFAFVAVTVALFGVSTAFGGRKTLAVEVQTDAPAPSTFVDFGFVPLNPNDPKVVELAKFAIGEFNKEYNKNVKFDSVLEALTYTESGPGTKYGLVILAVDNGPSAFNADVLVDKDSQKVIAIKENP